MYSSLFLYCILQEMFGIIYFEIKYKILGGTYIYVA